MIRKRFKVVKLTEGLIEEENDICPICCETMQEAVQMSCDIRHKFHKICIQSWLSKNRSCPMCKVEII